MARKRQTNEEFAVNVLQKRAERDKGMTHKQVVEALLKRNGLEYTDTTRKYYDPLLYGTNDWNGPVGVFYSRCVPTAPGTWKFVG
jgi:hypothetical protein